MRIPNVVIIAILIFGGLLSVILTTGTGPKERFTLNGPQLTYVFTGTRLSMSSAFTGTTGPSQDDPCTFVVTLSPEPGGRAPWSEICEGGLPGQPASSGAGGWSVEQDRLCLELRDRHRLRECREVRVGAGGFEILDRGGETSWTFTVEHPAHQTWESLRDALLELS